MSEKNSNEAESEQQIHGNGSVAHQIIGAFLSALQAKEGCSDIATRLERAVFETKVNEASLRSAIFGEESL